MTRATPWLRVPDTCFAVERADAAGVLIDARTYYRSFYEAALAAEREILITGWQVDSTVELLRGDDVAIAERAAGQTRLVKFLDHLCRTRDGLQIAILAWDFHMVLALEREWLQKLLFHWTTHERLQFVFDDVHPTGGCHHQKMALIDGELAFVGGIDLCESRWDDRQHLAENELRIARGKPQKPYHDMQAYLRGHKVVEPLTQLFRERWARAKGKPIPPLVARTQPLELRFADAVELPAGPVGISKTDPGCVEGSVACLEVAQLLVDAMARAEELIYVENQYFSSRAIRDALLARMRDGSRPKLDIVLVLNERAEAVKEQIAVGLKQAENLGILAQVARETGHALSAWFTVASPPGDEGNTPDAPGHHQKTERKGDRDEKRTYVHSKFLCVDDRLLTIGSANLTNRSLGLDTELHVSWDADAQDVPVAARRAIRRLRATLLAEHTGARGPAELRGLLRRRGLTAHLHTLSGPDHRLRKHSSPTSEEQRAMEIVDPQALPFDPASPDDPTTHEHALLRKDLGELWEVLTSDA